MKDLNLLYVFEAMWRDRSVTQAANRLGLSQAAVSNALKRMRQAHGDKLFTLAGKRMEPTPYATSISHHLLTALSLVQKAATVQPRFEPETSKRQFIIRARDIGEVVYFPQVWKRVTELGPNIRVRTTFQTMENTVAGLASGRIDFALGYLPTLETAIHRRPLFTQDYICLMRSGHPLAKQNLTYDLFRNQDHLLVDYLSSGHVVIERALIDAGAGGRIKVRLPQYLSAPHLIIASDLIWCAPTSLAKTLVKYYPLVLKPVPIDLPSFEVALYWHERFHNDAANQWMREVFVSTCEIVGKDLLAL